MSRLEYELKGFFGCDAREVQVFDRILDYKYVVAGVFGGFLSVTDGW